jgi:hypothetical protein
MYTLDKLGYRGRYDVYDQQGLGNTNNQIGGRMSPEQASRYSLIVYDAGNRTPGTPILPDGIFLDSEKIDMQSWFQTWNALSGGLNPEHTLWFIGANAMQEKPFSPLYTSDMAASFASADQGQDVNPNVFGVADFTNHTSCQETHTGELFALDGGCDPGLGGHANIRDYDDIRATGNAVSTHVYGSYVPSTSGAIVMHADPAGFSTILQSFPWFDMRTSIGQPAPTKPDEVLMGRILSCVLPGGCAGGPPTGTGEHPEQVAVPAHTTLHQNTPNPFNPVTTIHFDLAREGHVSLHIYDVAGRLVRTLVDESLTAGFDHRATWNGLDDAGTHVASGVYFYRLVAADRTATRKMVVMK